jgi:hypothetical protein
VKSVQNDIAIINLTKRLSMFKLSESINATSDKPAMGEPTPPPQGDKAPGFDPLAK